MFDKVKKILRNPMLVLLPLYLWLLVDTLNGIILRFVDLPVTLSNVFKAIVLFLALLTIRNRKHLYIAFGAIAIIVIATIAHLFNPLSEGISRFSLIFEDLLAGVKLVGPIIFTLSLLSIVPFLKQKHGKHLRLILLVNLGVIALNLGLSLIGVGYQQYKAGLGARGFFLSGNELALVFLTVSSAVLYFRRNLNSIVFFVFVAAIMLMAFLLATKVAVLGAALMIGFISLFLRYDPLAKLFKKQPLSTKNILWIVAFVVFLVAGLIAISQISYAQDFYWRTKAMIEMSGNALSGILSQRDVLAGAALNYIQNHFTIKDYIFGIGYDNISRAMEIYPPFRYGITEMDMVDIFFYLGGLSLFYYGLWIYMLVKMLAQKPITSAILFGVGFNLILLVISTFSGHTLFSAINAPFWAVINVVGLTGISMRTGLEKFIKKLYSSKILFVLPAFIFIGIDAISGVLRESSVPTITLSLVFKAFAVLCLLPLLTRRQIFFLIFCTAGVAVLTLIHTFNPLTALSGTRAVVFGDLQLMFKILMPVVYAFAFLELGKLLKAKPYRLLVLLIFASNFILILGNELIGVVQLLKEQGLTSATAILGQKGLLFSWNEFSIGYVTITAFLLYQLRNKNPVSIVAFAALVLFGTFMVSKKVAMFGTFLFTFLAFVVFRYDFWFKAINKRLDGLKRYLFWIAGIVLIAGALVFVGLKTVDIGTLAPTYQSQVDRVESAIVNLKAGETDRAMEALFSGRNRFSESAAEAIQNDFSVSDYIFGIGYRNINAAVGKYQPSHPGITEIDPVDIFMAIGVFGVLYYIAWLAWIIWLGTRIKHSPYFGFVLCLNLFLLAASATSGHIIYSGLNGAFFGILNGVALTINYHKNIKKNHNLVILSGMGKGGVRSWVETVIKYLKQSYGSLYQRRVKVIRTHAEVHQNLWNVIVFAFALLKVCAYAFFHCGETIIYHINVEQGGSFVRAALLAKLIERIPSAKIVLHIHGARFFEYAEKLKSSAKGVRKLQSFFKNRALKLVISLTPTRKEELEELLKELQVSPVFEHLVVPNPIEFEALKSTKEKDLSGRLELINVARFVPQKNQIALLKAIALLIKKGITNIHLTLIGDGELRPEFEKFIADNQLNNYVTLPGWIPHEKVKAYYEKAHVKVLPSVFESFGIVILEAFSAKLPAIVGKIGGVQDLIVEGENGYKVDPNAPEEIADAIERFEKDRKLIKTMGEINYKKAMEYDISNVGSQLENAYTTALQPEKPRVLLIASSGGHLNQLMMLKGWWQKYDRMFVAYDKIDSRTILKNEPRVLSKYTSIRNPLHVFATAALAYKTLKKYRPHLIFSTGEGLCVPFFYVGKYLFGAKTVLLDSLSKTHPSLSAYLSYFILDDLLTQWPDVAKKWKKFKYKGRVI